jgi:hypothetical protein
LLEQWIHSWCPDDSLFLQPDDWFEHAHYGNATFFWFPPPCAAEAAVKQLCDACHARLQCFHVFVAPCVMAYRWHKVLRKASDIFFTIGAGPSFWPASAHEPLTIAIACPYLQTPPFRFRERPLVSRLYSDLSGVWKGRERVQGDRLRQFWLDSGSLVTLQGRVAP